MRSKSRHPAAQPRWGPFVPRTPSVPRLTHSSTPAPVAGGFSHLTRGCLHPPQPALAHRFLTLLQPPGASDALGAEPSEMSPGVGWMLPGPAHSGAWHLPLQGVARSLHLWSDPCFREEQT